ncbi:MAG: extracellular solute-binding protein [Candidatus Kerfeldbacteria bacterium]|nr:extracellular solute-binding protein [Candidatus Kerfeldbacteria bacterium]
MNNQRGLSKIFILALFGFIALVILGVVFIIIGSQSEVTPTPVTIKVWGVFDDTTDLQPLFDAYTSAHPYVTFKYTKLRNEEYEDRLLKGWATDTGPDIYALPASWITKYKTEFITPIPKTTKVAYYTKKKVLFKTETQITMQTDTSLSANDVRRNYVDVVYSDVVADNAVYGLPLGIDTLVMYVNRELLNQATLVQAPQTWNEFTSAVTRLTIVDEQQNIVRAATALGTTENVIRSQDILTLLMLQNGTTMTRGSTISFAGAATSDASYLPGVEALRFYTDFANPQKAVYTWNAEQPNALDQFAQGELAFFFGYRYNEAEIMSKNRGVDYDIVAIPQVDPNANVNYANYWVYTVAKKTKAPNEAWNFLQFISSPARVKQYLESTNQTSSVRSVLQEQLQNPETAAEAEQALTAQSWYHGRDPLAVDTAFKEMIEAALEDPTTMQQAVKTAAQKIQLGY